MATPNAPIDELVERLRELDADDQGAHYDASHDCSIFAAAAARIEALSAELAALREPTEAMICAGGTAVERTKHLTGCERAKRIYLAMLDAALASSSQGEGR